MGAQRLLRGGLPLGSSYAHSLTLQAQTREAAQLNFRHVHNAPCMPLRRATGAARLCAYLALQAYASQGVAWRAEPVCMYLRVSACVSYHRVGDVYDISPALSAVEAGQCLNARQLEGVATALETALKAKETVEAQATGIVSDTHTHTHTHTHTQGHCCVYSAHWPLHACGLMLGTGVKGCLHGALMVHCRLMGAHPSCSTPPWLRLA